MLDAHVISSKEFNNSEDVLRWMLTVPKINPDSPRFIYYLTRWRVLEKIAAAKTRGDFDFIVEKCQPLPPDWIRQTAAALYEYDEYIFSTRESSGTTTPKIKLSPVAA